MKKGIKAKHRSDLIKLICDANPDVVNNEAEKIVDMLLAEMSTALTCGDRVEIRGFGSISIRQRNINIARNPKNGMPLEPSERATFYFRPSRDFLKSLNNKIANNNSA